MAKTNNPEGINQYTKKGGTFARLGQSLGGGLESVKMQAQGALKGAKVGAKVGSLVGSESKGAIKGASLGRSAGALAAKMSDKGEAAGAKLGAKVDRGVEKAGYAAKESAAYAADLARQAKWKAMDLKDRAEYAMETKGIPAAKKAIAKVKSAMSK